MHNVSKTFEYIELSDKKLRSAILNLENINTLANKLINKLNIQQLKNDQKQNFLSFIRQLNYKNFNNNFKGPNKINLINDKIIDIYINKIKTKEEKIDMHEILNDEIKNLGKNNTAYSSYTGVIKNKEEPKQSSKQQAPQQQAIQVVQSNLQQSIADLSTEQLIKITKIMNFESLWKDSYIIIDSRYRSLANNNNKEIEFNIIQNTKIKIPGTGNIYAHGDTRQIVQMEIFPFSIPYSAIADNFYNKITMSIKEMLPISFEAYEDSQFHFMFNSIEDGNLIKLSPINSVFKFYKPITHIGGSFTLRFGAPFAPVIFDKDRLNTLAINYTTDPMEIQFSEDHNLITGDLVYFDDFATLNLAADDDIIKIINRAEGHLSTRINNTTISINVNANIITNPNINHISTIYLGSKRIFIPMRLTYLLSANVNDV